MEPEKKSLEKEIPFGNHHFQVPCSISGEYPMIFHPVFFHKKKSPKNQGTEAAVSCKSGSLAACTTCVLASWQLVRTNHHQTIQHQTPKGAGEI